VIYLNFLYVILYFPPLSIAWWSAIFGEKEWMYDALIPEEMFHKVKTFSTFYDPHAYTQMRLAARIQ